MTNIPNNNENSTMVECPYCKGLVSPKASKCLHCGEFIKRKVSILLFLGMMFVPAIFVWFTLRKGYSLVARLFSFSWFAFSLYLVFGGSAASQFQNQEAGFAVMSGQKPVCAEELITLRKFNSIEVGMSYYDVVSILGKEGEVMSENSIMGIHTVMYAWSNGFSNMNAMFQDDRLIQKAQFGLK